MHFLCILILLWTFLSSTPYIPISYIYSLSSFQTYRDVIDPCPESKDQHQRAEMVVKPSIYCELLSVSADKSWSLNHFSFYSFICYITSLVLFTDASLDLPPHISHPVSKFHKKMSSCDGPVLKTALNYTS